MNPILDRPIKDTTLPTRAKNVLKRLEAKTVGDATKLTRTKILRSKWAGTKVLSYIENFLTELGLSLTEENAVSTQPGFALLNNYLNLKQQLFDYFGYKEDWVAIPLEDRTEMHWLVSERQPVEGRGMVTYSPQPLTADLIFSGSNVYTDSIYTQRFLPKWIYRGEKFTMICVDTHTDGNKFLAVFDNSKETTPSTHGAQYPRLAEAAKRWDLFGDLGVPPDLKVQGYTEDADGELQPPKQVVEVGALEGIDESDSE
jgi:Bacterial RNA polymerase, alpha chain C terminal domain